MSRKSCAVYVVGIVCASLLVLGIGLYVARVFRTVMHNRLKKEIVLVEGSRVFDSWKSPPPPVYMEYFFFNVTNLDEFLGGAKPVLKQVGPYTYREYRYKDNVSMVENDTMVSAYNVKSFVFLRDKSVGDPAVDNITTVNIPAWAVMKKVEASYKSFLVSLWMNSMGSGLFTTRTVDELLWGYEDPLLARVSATSPDVDKMFGLMYKKNGTDDGEFLYHTGVQNYLDYGRVKTWKDKNERIYIFTPDLCRSIYMEFEKELEVKGIPAYRFTPPRSVLASKEENPANEGFCVTPRECLGTGLLKVSPCRKGAPVVASFPHFYLADDKYVADIEGMRPQREHHQTFLDLNPTTGVIVRANKRAQINVLIGKVAGFPKTRAIVNDTVFPVMFLNESVVIDDASAARVQKLLLIVNVVSNFPLIIVGLGGILLIIFIILMARAHNQKNEVKRIVFTKPSYTTSTEDDTSYSPVSDKEKDDPQNGTFIGLTPKADPQA
ncbi:hypothetical protein Q5P01_024850 [Channa striata]|uniref:Lysosome membrane protein 2-like n=1 Tax=Channa striata TaxID=64152 RepID=A0AA88IUF9_CHASR|nr:hypothetical protein Q5P01_024850 [Channa striata]